MALEDILRAMAEQARAEVARIKSQAESEASAVIAKAEEEARAIKARHLADSNIRGHLQNERARLLNEAKRVALHQVMATRETLIEEAFGTAKTQLARLREKREYPEYLALLTREVVEELGRELRIVVDAQDVALMRRITAELSVEAEISTGLNSVGGLEATTPDGRIGLVNTVEARLKHGEEYLRREIASLLFAEDGSWERTMAMLMRASGR